MSQVSIQAVINARLKYVTAMKMNSYRKMGKSVHFDGELTISVFPLNASLYCIYTEIQCNLLLALNKWILILLARNKWFLIDGSKDCCQI